MNKILALGAVFLFIFSLSGCATTKNNKDLEAQGLRNQIMVLESQIQTKDNEISVLRDELSKLEKDNQALASELETKQAYLEAKTRPSIKQIQTALLNAGYNPGAIDGKLGKQTKEAIKAFQKANNLNIDGTVGKKTWSLLREYLDKKIK
jgi:murein L,D-transpeptidase YcbB/YkuD